jgi:hypothetical protein
MASGLKLVPGPPKGMERAAAKVTEKYKGNAKMLADSVRGGVSADTVQDA